MIVWGKKLVYRKLGYVVDFCRLCREVRTFELQRVGLAGHIYFISLAQGVLVEHRRRCSTCGTDFVATPEIYARASTHDGPLRELLKLTFPDLASYHAERLALEKAIRDPFAKISQENRQALLREPFKLLAHMAEERFQGSQIDAESIAFFLAALLVGGAVGAGLVSVLPKYAIEIWMSVLFSAAIATWILSVWSRRRFIRKRILPPLLSALHPLKPTREEITAVLKDVKGLGLSIGSQVKAESVMIGLKAYVAPKVT